MLKKTFPDVTSHFSDFSLSLREATVTSSLFARITHEVVTDNRLSLSAGQQSGLTSGHAGNIGKSTNQCTGESTAARAFSAHVIRPRLLSNVVYLQMYPPLQLPKGANRPVQQIQNVCGTPVFLVLSKCSFTSTRLLRGTTLAG